MRIKMWLMMVVMSVLLGCNASASSKTVDGRNGDEAFFASLHSMGEGMSEEEIERMEENMIIISDNLVGYDKTFEIEELMKRLDGMTAQDVIKLADALRK